MPALVIDLEARFAQFLDALTRVERDTKRTAGTINSAFAGVKTTLAGLGVGLSVAGFVAFAKNAVDSAAALDDMAERTGATVEGLSRLQQVARISGTDLGIVENFLIKLSKALHETDEEGKGANRALNAIGLSAEQLRSIAPEKQMELVAKAMDKFKDGSGKTAAILALTGRGAAEALPFLKDLANEMGVLAKKTPEQTAAAEELQKSFRRLANQSKEAGDAFIGNMVPALTRIVKALDEARKESGNLMAIWVALGGVGTELGKTMLNFYGFNLDDATKAANKVKEVGEQLAFARKQLETGQRTPTQQGAGLMSMFPNMRLSDADLEKVKAKISFLEKEQTRLLANSVKPKPTEVKPEVPLDTKPPKIPGGSTADPFAQMRERFEKELATMGNTAQKAAAELESAFKFDKTLGKIPEVQKEILRNLASEIDARKLSLTVAKAQVAAEEDRLALSAEARNAASADDVRMREAGEAIRRQLDPAIELQERIREITNLIKSGFLSPEDGDLEIERLTIKWRDAEAAANSYGLAVKETNDWAKELGLTFSLVFEDAIAGGKKFSDILKALGQNIAKIITRKTVTEPLEKAFTSSFSGGGGIGDIFKKLFGGGGSGYQFLGEAAGGMANVPADGMLFVHRGERVLTAAENRGGGTVIHQTNNFGSNVDHGTLIAWGQQVKQQTIAAVDDLNRRR